MNSVDEKTVSRDETLAFIAAHCDWNMLPDETAAARRLIEAGITNEDLDRMRCNAELQDRINAILYAGFGNE